MFRSSMNDLLPTQHYFLCRSVFQSIFHTALVVDKKNGCFGMLGAMLNNPKSIAFAEVVNTADGRTDLLALWQSQGIHCIGFYHMMGVDTPEFISQKMHDTYIILSVDLDEKGRLDLLGYACYQGQCSEHALTLNLIEDGQKVTDA